MDASGYRCTVFMVLAAILFSFVGVGQVAFADTSGYASMRSDFESATTSHLPLCDLDRSTLESIKRYANGHDLHRVESVSFSSNSTFIEYQAQTNEGDYIVQTAEIPYSDIEANATEVDIMQNAPFWTWELLLEGYAGDGYGEYHCLETPSSEEIRFILKDSEDNGADERAVFDLISTHEIPKDNLVQGLQTYRIDSQNGLMYLLGPSGLSEAQVRQEDTILEFDGDYGLEVSEWEALAELLGKTDYSQSPITERPTQPPSEDLLETPPSECGKTEEQVVRDLRREGGFDVNANEVFYKNVGGDLEVYIETNNGELDNVLEYTSQCPTPTQIKTVGLTQTSTEQATQGGTTVPGAGPNGGDGGETPIATLVAYVVGIAMSAIAVMFAFWIAFKDYVQDDASTRS